MRKIASVEAIVLYMILNNSFELFTCFLMFHYMKSETWFSEELCYNEQMLSYFRPSRYNQVRL